MLPASLWSENDHAVLRAREARGSFVPYEGVFDGHAGYQVQFEDDDTKHEVASIGLPACWGGQDVETFEFESGHSNGTWDTASLLPSLTSSTCTTGPCTQLSSPIPFDLDPFSHSQAAPGLDNAELFGALGAVTEKLTLSADDEVPNKLMDYSVTGASLKEADLPLPKDVDVQSAAVGGPAHTKQTELMLPYRSLPQQEQSLPHSNDLYTPQWVCGEGAARKGWCVQCESWLTLKNRAYWYNKTFKHGISAVTGMPFLEPTERRLAARSRTNSDSGVSTPSKRSKAATEGKCSTCGEWIPLGTGRKGTQHGQAWYRHAYKVRENLRDPSI